MTAVVATVKRPVSVIAVTLVVALSAWAWSMTSAKKAVAQVAAAEYTLVPCWMAATSWGAGAVLAALFTPPGWAALVGWALFVVGAAGTADTCVYNAPPAVSACLRNQYKGTYGGVKYYKAYAANCVAWEYGL